MPFDLPRLRRLIEVLAEMHDRGDFLDDPSPALLRWDLDGNPQFAESEIEKRSHAGLADLSLNQVFALLHGASPRVKILGARLYCSRRGFDVDVEAMLQRHTEGAIERCFQRNRDFKSVQAGGMVWHVRRDLADEALAQVFVDPDRFLRPGAKMMKNGRGTTVAEVPGDAVLKRFNLKKVSNVLKHGFAATRARRAFQKAYHLELMGVRTPRAIAFADRTRLGFVHKSYLIVERVPHGRTGAELLSGTARRISRRAAIDAGTQVGRLHGSGFSNRDLKPSNLLFDASDRAWLLDLDGVRHVGQVDESRRLKNLRRLMRDLPANESALLVSAARFLRAYARASRSGTMRGLLRSLREDA